jgi:hypothetical protein
MFRVVADGPLVENQDEPWEVIGVFGNQFAYGGETLATTTVVDAGEPSESVAGWLVRIGVTRRTVLGTVGAWAARLVGEERWFGRLLIRVLVRTGTTAFLWAVPRYPPSHDPGRNQ